MESEAAVAGVPKAETVSCMFSVSVPANPGRVLVNLPAASPGLIFFFLLLEAFQMLENK